MMSAAPRLMIRSCSSTGGNSRRLTAPALYHTDFGGARHARPAGVARYNVGVMALRKDDATSPPKRPLWRRRWFRRTLIGVGALALLFVIVVGVAALWAFTILPRSLPSVTALETLQPIQGTKIYDDNDEPMTELHVERRILVPLAQIPQSLRDAILATEDRRFYSHWGIDPIGVARAILQNYRRGRIVEGGSTITQQLTKVLFLTPDKSLERKLKEAVLALELERRYSKDRILEMYLNQVYFGHGSYGVEAAARTFFGKPVSELTVKESALIAGLPRAPSNYSPFDRADAAKRRREVVLRRMVDFGVLKDEESKRLAKTDLGLIPPERRRTTGQYFVEYVQQSLEANYGPDLVLKGGLNVYTTLNPTMQLAAEQSLRDGLKALQGRSAQARPGESREGAVITVEPQTGYVTAMVGGSDFLRSEFNRAVQAKRQPGSAFKPFIYIAALEAGFTPASQIEDSPVSYTVGGGQPVWKPENYDRKFRGSTTLQQAIEESVNVVTVKLQERIGLSKTIQVARRLGIASPLDVNLSLALGTSDLSLLELTSAYGVLANQGVWMPPVTIRYVTDAQGKLLEEHVPEGREAIAPETAYVITHMLRGVVERGTGQAAKALGRPIAAKTGTTNDYSNAWFIGFTPRLATGVWVGYDRPRSLGKDETRSRGAVPIWVRYMGRVPPGHLRPRSAGEESTEPRRQLGNGHADLLHRVPLPDGDAPVAALTALGVPGRLDVHRDAIWCPDLVLPAIEAPDGRGVVVDHAPLPGERGADRVGGADDVVTLLEERKHGNLQRRQLRVEPEHDPLLAAHFLLAVGIGHEGQERSVHPGRRLDDERDDVLLALLVEVRERLAAPLRVLLEVEVGTVGDTHQLAPADREVVLDVHRALGVVRQLVALVLADSQIFVAQAVALEPREAVLDPPVVPVLVGRPAVDTIVRVDEELDLHLLELTIPEDEVARRDLVAERSTGLRDAERQLQSHRLQDVVEVHEHRLGRLRTQVGERGVLLDGAHERLEHEG